MQKQTLQQSLIIRTLPANLPTVNPDIDHPDKLQCCNNKKWYLTKVQIDTDTDELNKALIACGL